MKRHGSMSERQEDGERLRPIVEAVAAWASRPAETTKKEVWARHQALLPTKKRRDSRRDSEGTSGFPLMRQ
ncbi:MAG: hypothetical protein HY332_15560 [Chloroflexi bacterium]|nr:hypothetical protein [Chloroflexota bacterium]